MNDAPRTTRKPKGEPAARDVPRPEFLMPTARILEPLVVQELIRHRQKMGIDQYDEVWDGVYVVPPLATNPHQTLVGEYTTVLMLVVRLEGKGLVLPGANVSDRRRRWEKSFRCPDVVVVLNGGRAVDCGTHWLGGPDFLIEIRSPGDDTDEKLPFYSLLGVRELLIVHRDTRELQLFRHDGNQLALVGTGDAAHPGPLVSEVLPLKFSYQATRTGPRTVVQRTEGKRKSWTI
jgi:Uma2 family endonuclease